MGRNKKFRAIRLETGNYSWGSECVTRKPRIIDVLNNASNNELVQTKTLKKTVLFKLIALHSDNGMKLTMLHPLVVRKALKNNKSLRSRILLLKNDPIIAKERLMQGKLKEKWHLPLKISLPLDVYMVVYITYIDKPFSLVNMI